MSSNAADFFATGIKGRYRENRYEDNVVRTGTYRLPMLEDGKLVEKDIPLRNAMNEVLRDEYVKDCERALRQWNRTLEKAGSETRLTLPSRRFHRHQGIYAGTFFNPDGEVITEDEYRGQTMRVLYVSFLSSFALELLSSLSVAIVAVTVGFRLAFGEMPFDIALFVLILAPEAFLPVRQVGVHFHDSADGVAAAQAALDLIDHGVVTSGDDLPDESHIILDDVRFTWPGTDEPAVADARLSVPEGRIVALTGPSGGGKSTVLSLVMGFQRPDAGRVLVGSRDLADLDLAAWRRRTAWVAQEPGMVHGTVGDNVRLGIPGAHDDEVAAALREVGADFDAAKNVGDDGEGLSGGERRRVALARALLRIRHGGARLLVLDEPTAGLDADAEAAVIRAVRESGVGALVVTHRPAMLAAADEVVTL